VAVIVEAIRHLLNSSPRAVPHLQPTDGRDRASCPVLDISLDIRRSGPTC